MKLKPFCKIGCDGVVKSKADSGMLQICKLSLASIWQWWWLSWCDDYYHDYDHNSDFDHDHDYDDDDECDNFHDDENSEYDELSVCSKMVVDSVSLNSWLHMWARMCQVQHHDHDEKYPHDDHEYDDDDDHDGHDD